MKNADMPAMPVSHRKQVGSMGECLHHDTVMEGLTKREMFAMHAMQAQISAMGNNESMEMSTLAMIDRGIDLGNPEKLVAINACNYADALLAELEK